MIHLIRFSLGILGLVISGLLLFAIDALCRTFSPSTMIAVPIVLFLIYGAGMSIHDAWSEEQE